MNGQGHHGSLFGFVFRLATVLASVPATAVAGEPEPAPEDIVVPPRLIEDPGAAYPRRALDEHFYDRVEITLILELDVTGKLVHAIVEAEGQGTERDHGFIDAALEAAQRLRFEPARRGEQAVASRIRYRYAFEPPAPTFAGQVLDAATGEPLSEAIVVLRDADGTEHAALTAADGSYSIAPVARGAGSAAVRAKGRLEQRIAVNLVPGDETRVVFRVSTATDVAAAPKDAPVEVTVRGEKRNPVVSSYTRAEVRQIPGAFGDPFRAVDTLPGVTPLATGLPFFYLRGAPPGNVGYFLDGVRVPYLYHVGAGPSVVHPATVERVDVYPGGYPAELGRFSGGIVSADTTAPRPEFHGEGNLRLFDVGGLAEAGFADGRGTVMLGGRYSYTAALLSLAAPEIHLDYRDLQARATYDVTPDDTLGVFAFGAYDLLKRNGKVLFGSEFYRADVRYDHRFTRGSLRTAVTLGYDRTSAAIFDDDDRRNLTNRSISLRTELVEALGADVSMHAGASATLEAYRPEGASYSDPEGPEQSRFASIYERRLDHVTGTWVSLVIDATPAIQLIPGVRADLYGSGRNTALGVDPRLAARFAIGKRVRLIPAVGLASQPPSFLIPLPGVAPPLGEGLQRSLQSSGGVEVDLDERTTAGSTLFYNAFFDMTDAFGTSGQEPTKGLDVRSHGHAYGAEFFLRHRLTSRFSGFLSYTLSRSIRTVKGREFLSAFDRTHVGNAAVSYDLGRGWKAGSRFLFYTGTPRWNDESESGPVVTGTHDVPRESTFYRLDVRLEKRWSLRGSSWVSFVLEFLNATLNKETWPGGEEVGPIAIPSLGVEAGF
jgi:hypothetical protein